MALDEEELLLRNGLLEAFKKQGYLEKEQLKDIMFLLGRNSKVFRGILKTTINYKKKQRILQRTIRKFGPRPV